MLDGVGFGYVSGRPVLHDVSLRLAAGDHVALVGPTGAGKSTVAKLAAGLLAPDPGQITLGGVDLSDVNPVELRRRIVLLPQGGHVLAGTLAENLRLAPPLPSAAVRSSEPLVSTDGKCRWPPLPSSSFLSGPDGRSGRCR